MSITPHNNADLAYNPLEGNRPELSVKLHESSNEHISIIIVHKDRPEYLNICLQSIAVTSFNNNYEIIVVDNGKIIEQGSHAELLEKENSLYKKLWELQAGGFLKSESDNEDNEENSDEEDEDDADWVAGAKMVNF